MTSETPLPAVVPALAPAVMPPSIFDGLKRLALPPAGTPAPSSSPVVSAPRRGPGRPRKNSVPGASVGSVAPSAPAGPAGPAAPVGDDAILTILRSPVGAVLCADVYRIPWDALAVGSGVDVVPSSERLRRGGDALRIMLEIYGGGFLKYLPAVNLAACVLGDGMAAYRAIRVATRAPVVGVAHSAVAPVAPVPAAPETETVRA